MNIEKLILYDNIISRGEKIILFDENNTYWNIREYLKDKHPDTKIIIVNEGKGLY